MCAASAYTLLPIIQFLYVRQGLRESGNTGNPLVINKEWITRAGDGLRETAVNFLC